MDLRSYFVYVIHRNIHSEIYNYNSFDNPPEQWPVSSWGAMEPVTTHTSARQWVHAWDHPIILSPNFKLALIKIKV